MYDYRNLVCRRNSLACPPSLSHHHSVQAAIVLLFYRSPTLFAFVLNYFTVCVIKCLITFYRNPPACVYVGVSISTCGCVQLLEVVKCL